MNIFCFNNSYKLSLISINSAIFLCHKPCSSYKRKFNFWFLNPKLSDFDNLNGSFDSIARDLLTLFGIVEFPVQITLSRQDK